MQNNAELERRSVYQLRLKAVEILRSRTQLVKSHGDDLGLEYLWNGDEYGSLEITKNDLILNSTPENRL